MNKLIGNPWVLLAALAGLVALASLAFWQGWRAGSGHVQAAWNEEKLAALAASLRLADAQTDITDAVGAKYGGHMATILVETRTLIQKVPVYVTPETDARYPLPRGLVRLYNASGQSGADAVSLAAEPADAAPAGVSASAFATIAIENNGALNACRAQVLGLQEFARRQHELTAPAH